MDKLEPETIENHVDLTIRVRLPKNKIFLKPETMTSFLETLREARPDLEFTYVRVQ